MSEMRKNYENSMQQIVSFLKEFNLEDERTYVSWLTQTYFFARMTTRLLAIAAAEFPIESSRLHNRFLDHTREEKNHDLLLLRDLKHFGAEKEDLIEFSSTASFYMSQFYLIEHVSPISFFGYILILEGAAAKYGDEATQRVANKFGAGPTSFLKVHGAEDKEHVEQALTELELLPVSEQKIVSMGLKLSADLYLQLLKNCQSQKSTIARTSLGRTG